ncbi:hypothetical protein I552_4264 [Mycobacterium xenopi 3993]|nr:hypothetical protein I552_4264 [Mycobacterium xenopi 3993]
MRRPRHPRWHAGQRLRRGYPGHELCCAGPAFGPMPCESDDVVAAAEHPRDESAAEYAAGPVTATLTGWPSTASS